MEFGKDLCHSEIAKNLERDMIYDAYTVKIFNIYKQRNEWVNWSGDTSLINRAVRTFSLTKKEAQNLAEKYRKRGTKFIINECPAICVISDKRSLIMTELFEKKPMSRYEDHLNHVTKGTSLADVNLSILNSGWVVKAIYSGDRSVLTIPKKGEVFYSWTSYPQGSGCHLGWLSNPRDISPVSVKQIIKKMRISLRNLT